MHHFAHGECGCKFWHDVNVDNVGLDIGIINVNSEVDIKSCEGGYF